MIAVLAALAFTNTSSEHAPSFRSKLDVAQDGIGKGAPLRTSLICGPWALLRGDWSNGAISHVVKGNTVP